MVSFGPLTSFLSKQIKQGARLSECINSDHRDQSILVSERKRLLQRLRKRVRQKEIKLMTTTWILSANRSSATFHESDWPGKSMRRIQDIPHPEGRKQNREIDPDMQGRSVDSFGQGRHAMSTEQEPTEHIAQQFALDLAERLNKGRVEHAYDKLVLMAEPKFLGVQRGALNKNTAVLIVQTVSKELPNVKEEDLAKYLK